MGMVHDLASFVVSSRASAIRPGGGADCRGARRPVTSQRDSVPRGSFRPWGAARPTIIHAARDPPDVAGALQNTEEHIVKKLKPFRIQERHGHAS